MRGNSEKAAVSYRRAAGLLEKLLRSDSDNSGAKSELVLTYLGAPLDAFPDYERLLVQARDMNRELHDAPRPPLDASLTLKLGWVCDKTGNRAGAERAYREAIETLKPPPPRDPREPGEPRPPNLIFEQTLARSLLAALLADTDRLREARGVLEEAVAELRRFSERPRSPGMGGRPPWELIAMTHQQLAEVCERLGDRDAAAKAKAEANRAVNPGPGGPPWGGGGWGGPGGKGPNPPRKN
jgi:tetratricopeptide (TPR) repeat protein